MAINQKIAPMEHGNESQGSTHYSPSSDEESSACSTDYVVEHGEIDSIMNRTRTGRGRRIRATGSRAAPSLGASPTCGKTSGRARRVYMNSIANLNSNSNSKLAMMMRRLRVHLDSLRALLPPAARSSHSCSVIADALRYRKTLEKEIELLLMAIPYSKQVDVRRVECGGLHIGITCKKKSGLMVALMEAMESFGLHFASVNASCQDDNITIDALSTQENVGNAGALKGMLVATIARFSRGQ